MAAYNLLAGVLGAFGLCVALPASAAFHVDDFRGSLCGAREPLFRSGLEAAEVAGVEASGGASEGGSGSTMLSVQVPENGRIHHAYLQVPSAYSPQVAAPLVLLLHGGAGSPAGADLAASSLRLDWQAAADSLGAIVLAPVASGGSGGWVPTLDSLAIACLIAEVEARFSIDRSRRYLWGFSAGGHYGHSLALRNATRFAAYSVKAGALAGLVCNPYWGVADCAGRLPAALPRIPVQLRAGQFDSLQSYMLSDQSSFSQAGWIISVDLSVETVGGGHQVLFEDPAAAAAWFSLHALP